MPDVNNLPTKVPTVITVFNTKGGSGKTTLASALAVQLAQHHSTAAIDLDRQGQLTTALGRKRDDGVAKWLTPIGGLRFEALFQEDFGSEKPHPAVLGSGVNTAGLDAMLAVYRVMGGLPEAIDNLYLRRRIERDLFVFDYAVLDTAAAGYLAELAVAAADIVVVPVSLRALDVDGTRSFADSVSAQVSAGTEIMLVPNRFDRRAPALARTHMAEIENIAGSKGWRMLPPIPESADVDKAFTQGVILAEARPTHAVSLGCAQITDTILATGKQGEPTR